MTKKELLTCLLIALALALYQLKDRLLRIYEQPMPIVIYPNEPTPEYLRKPTLETRTTDENFLGTFITTPAVLEEKTATFPFTYSGSPTYYTIYLSTAPDMSTDVYIDFAYGSSSPLTVTNPQKWDKYTCGSTLYWTVRTLDGKMESPIEAATVECNS